MVLAPNLTLLLFILSSIFVLGCLSSSNCSNGVNENRVIELLKVRSYLHHYDFVSYAILLVQIKPDLQNVIIVMLVQKEDANPPLKKLHPFKTWFKDAELRRAPTTLNFGFMEEAQAQKSKEDVRKPGSPEGIDNAVVAQTLTNPYHN